MTKQDKQQTIGPASRPTPSIWVSEAHTPNDIYNHGINRVIYAERTPFQDMLIADVGAYGRALFLDGCLQTSEGDETFYHEPIVHPACIAVGGAPKSVLILGGGDGGTAREVLRWKSVQRVVNVEIDEAVVNACKQHLPSLSSGAFTDPKLEMVFDDAHTFLQQSEERFDVIICDLTDPIEHGPSVKLFALNFFQNLKSHLIENDENGNGTCGAICLQSGTMSLSEDDVNLGRIVTTLKKVFVDVNVMQTYVPKYGTPLALTLATTKTLQLPSVTDVDAIFNKNLNGENHVLDGRALHALFAIPKCVSDNLRRTQKLLTEEDRIRLISD